MIHVVASISVKDGRREEFLSIFKANIPRVLEERGCIEYLPAVDTPTGLAVQELNDSGVTILEKWESMDDLRAHLSAPHMLEYRERVKDLVLKVSLKVLKGA
ncbi:MAG: antibiotic biosynthesis monooxygenase [Planctomycetes bacterium]|nr:antibiotic biosynthesis monooxygenase [Planctomycetota bacterium]